MKPLICVKNVYKRYRLGSTSISALRGANLEIFPGEVVGLVGESGSGKSTLARLILGLERPTQGQILFEGKDPARLSAADRKWLCRKMQTIFQDPHAALNPRMTALDLVAEGLDIHGLVDRTERVAYVQELLKLVGLPPDCLNRFPHQFSGGQRQRICIARALAVKPQFLICDEPTSALDVSIQAQVVNLLKDLQKSMGLTYLLIAHDLAIVRYLANRIAVMHQGEIVECETTEELLQSPKHPQTQALLRASAFNRFARAAQHRL